MGFLQLLPEPLYLNDLGDFLPMANFGTRLAFTRPTPIRGSDRGRVHGHEFFSRRTLSPRTSRAGL
jgi:hypothetical protein